jgi:hypothetical protein
MILAPFLPAHLQEIELQRKTPKDVGLFSDPRYGESLLSGDAFSVFDGPTLKASLGVFDFMPGVGIAWAMFSQDAGSLLPALSLRARKYLRNCRFRRIEAYIDPNFAESIRWATLMGFQFEGVMKKHSPRGDDLMYAWVKGDD